MNGNYRQWDPDAENIITEREWNALSDADKYAYHHGIWYGETGIFQLDWLTATPPKRAHAGDLGYDLFSAQDILIQPQEVAIVQTGIRIKFPAGVGGLIKDRSSIATQLKLFTVGGVIDCGYRGLIGVPLFNASNEAQQILIEDKIAQLVLVPLIGFDFRRGSVRVDDTARGEGGFGSTGG